MHKIYAVLVQFLVSIGQQIYSNFNEVTPLGHERKKTSQVGSVSWDIFLNIFFSFWWQK